MKAFSILLLFIASQTLLSQNEKEWLPIIGSAYVDNASYSMLQRLCDEAGGRLMGSPADEKALQILSEELVKIGFEAKIERFKAPGWVRGDDEVIMLSPSERKLRAVALGYVERAPQIDAALAYMKQGYEEDYQNMDVSGKVILVTSEAAPGKPELIRSEAIRIAAKHGGKAILFMHDKPGGITLSGTSSFQGLPSPIPAYSITLEEGKWLQRLLQKTVPVSMRIVTKSYCKEVSSANIVITLPGKVKDKIVVGAHMDAWDVGQGGIDNGQGTAILFDIARLMKTFSPKNYYTVDFVWFNGEELGLWGAKRYLEMHKEDNILAAINMDMTGSPTAFNAMGTDTLVPFLQNLAQRLNGFNLKSAVPNNPWTNSDHQPFMLTGIPTITLHGHLDQEMVRHYHDFGDTFEKVNKKYISDAAAVITILTKELANNREIKLARRNKAETIEFLKKHKLEDRLKRQKEWFFD